MGQQQGGTDFRVPLGLSWNMPKQRKKNMGRNIRSEMREAGSCIQLEGKGKPRLDRAAKSGGRGV